MFRRNVARNNRSAKNYTHKVAQSRLSYDVLPIVQQFVDNSNRVNSAPIMYFTKNMLGRPCSCQTKSHIPQDLQQDEVNQFTLRNTKNSHVKIKQHGMLFGEPNAADADVEDLFPTKLEDREAISDTDFILSESFDCGVCYRTGIVPGYSLVGAQSTYITFNSGNIAETNHYTLDTVSTPERFVRTHEDGYVLMVCSIPSLADITKFYYSVRDNREILFGSILYHPNLNLPIINTSLFLSSVQKVYSDELGADEYLFYFKIREKQFTHVVIHCLTTSELYANISEESLSLDYTMVNTLSNVTLTIPPRLPKVRSGDVIYIPKRNLTLKVSDFSRKNTVDFQDWEYTVNTRQLQPQETLISLPVYDSISIKV